MTRPQRLRALGLLLFFALTFAVASVYFRAAGTSLIPLGSHYTAEAVVPTAVSLAVKADVREAGINVGKVDQIAASGPTGAASLVKFQLDSHAPIYRDAKVFVRTKSVAGENYLELNPGTPSAGALPSGGVIGIDHAQEATQIDQILSIFDQTRQRDLQRALYGLAGGLNDGGGRLNRTLEAASALPEEGSAAARELDGDRAQVASLVDTFGTVTRALGDRRAAIELLTKQLRVASQAVADRDAQLRSVLGELPAFLSQARRTADHLHAFSISATPVVHHLRVAVQDLVPAVQVLLPAAREGRVVVQRLRAFATAAAPALRVLKPFAGAADAFVPPLTALVRRGKPLVTYFAPYRQELASFFATDAASLEPADRLGHVARIILPISISNLAGVLSPAQVQLLQRLDAAFDSRGHNAYPAPGQVAASVPFGGGYPHLQPDPPYSS
jgi:phospholipid/cholesterol/gamma-HCH transport system substrate-binding protein